MCARLSLALIRCVPSVLSAGCWCWSVCWDNVGCVFGGYWLCLGTISVCSEAGGGGCGGVGEGSLWCGGVWGGYRHGCGGGVGNGLGGAGGCKCGCCCAWSERSERPPPRDLSSGDFVFASWW